MALSDAERQRRYRDRHRVDLDPIACSECGWWFLPKRKDARTCSSACRTRRSRRLRAGAKPDSVVTWVVRETLPDDPTLNVVLITDPADEVGTWTIRVPIG